MDSSAYVRRRKETMTQFIRRPIIQDAGAYIEQKGRIAAAQRYVSPNTHVSVPTDCDIPKAGYKGSASAEPIYPTPGCCTSVTSVSLPCCSMIYDPAQPVPACKVLPYYATPTQQKTAATQCCSP